MSFNCENTLLILITVSGLKRKMISRSSVNKTHKCDKNDTQTQVNSGFL